MAPQTLPELAINLQEAGIVYKAYDLPHFSSFLTSTLIQYQMLYTTLLLCVLRAVAAHPAPINPPIPLASPVTSPTESRDPLTGDFFGDEEVYPTSTEDFSYPSLDIIDHGPVKDSKVTHLTSVKYHDPSLIEDFTGYPYDIPTITTSPSVDMVGPLKGFGNREKGVPSITISGETARPTLHGIISHGPVKINHSNLNNSTETPFHTRHFGCGTDAIIQPLACFRKGVAKVSTRTTAALDETAETVAPAETAIPTALSA